MRFLISFLALFMCLQGTPAFAGLFGSSMEKAEAVNGQVILNLASLEKGQSQHYKFQQEGKTIRFFVVRDNQGVLRAALDACDVCWQADKGYKMQDGAMLCVNCGQSFALGRIGEVKGGCNPHPIAFTANGDTLTITAAELVAGAGYFPSNK